MPQSNFLANARPLLDSVVAGENVGDTPFTTLTPQQQRQVLHAIRDILQWIDDVEAEQAIIEGRLDLIEASLP